LAAQNEATHSESDGLPGTPARYAGGSLRKKVSSHETPAEAPGCTLHRKSRSLPLVAPAILSPVFFSVRTTPPAAKVAPPGFPSTNLGESR